MRDRLNIIEEITDKRYENSLVFTFNCSLTFYEDLILKPLLNNGCFNNTILMDQKQYDILINNEKDKVHYCGSYYLCEGVKTKGAFHPKIVLLTGKDFGKLLIGSGNATFFGYGNNFELFYKFDYDDSHKDYLFLFQEVVGYIDQLCQKLGIAQNPALVRRIKLLKETTPWLNQEAHHTKEKFLHNLHRPILDQILEIAPKNLKKIVLGAPYYGGRLETIQRLQRKYPNSDITILTQSGNTNFPIDYFFSNKKLFSRVSLHKVSQPVTGGRPFHGKFIYLASEKGEMFFSGSPNITKAALESTVAEGNVEVGMLLGQDSRNQLSSLWNEFLDEKKVSERDEFLVSTKIEEVPKPEIYPIKIMQAYLDGSMLNLSYESELTGPAELFLNGNHFSKIKLSKTGKIVESIATYLNQYKNDNCLFVQIKSKNYQSNLLWASNTLVKKNTEKAYITKQINSLASYVKDLSFIDWLIELSPNLRRREYGTQNIITSFDLVKQEESGEKNELPENLFFVEEKPDYCIFLQKTSDSRIYTYDNNMLNEVLSSLLHIFGKIVPSGRGAVSGGKTAEEKEKIQGIAEHEEEEEIDVFNIHDKIFAKINSLISKNITNLNQLPALDTSTTLNLCDFLVFLIWTFDGIEIAVGDEEDKVFINAKQYLEASVVILERLWSKTNMGDYLESKKDETGYAYLRMTKIYALCLCLVSFNMWVLLNRDEFIEDLKKYEEALMEIFFAITEKIKRLPSAVVKDILAEEKANKITEKLSNFNGFNIKDINLIRLLKLKTKKVQLEKMIDIVNAERFSHLLGKKKRERSKLDEELTKAIIQFEEYRRLLQIEPGKHVLDYNIAEKGIPEVKQKIEENERIVSFLSGIKKEPMRRAHLPREILRFFCLDI